MIDEDALKRIEDLHRLKTEGVITEADFEKAKADLLSGTAPRRHSTSTTATPTVLPDANDHVGWMTLPLRRYAEFHGRSTRKEFWMFQLIYVALALVTAVLVGVGGVDEYGEGTGLSKLAVGLFVIALLGLFVPLLAVQTRRFHDQDRSGWFVLLNLIPYLGTFAVFIFMLLEGTRGDNRFGPDPRG